MTLENSILERILSNSTVEYILVLLIACTYTFEILKTFINSNKNTQKKNYIIAFIYFISISIIISIINNCPDASFLIICASIIFIFVKIICSIKINTYQNIFYIITITILFLISKALTQNDINISSLYLKEICQISLISFIYFHYLH